MPTKKKGKTIGQMANTRGVWGFNPITQIAKNKKGKGSYNRQASKKVRLG